MIRLPKIELKIDRGYQANFFLGVGWAGRFAVAWWVAELIMWVVRPATPIGDIRGLFFSALGAAFLIGFACLVLCPLTGLTLAALAGREPFVAWAAGAARRALQRRFGSLVAARDLARAVAAGLFWLAFWGLVGWRLCLYFMTHMAMAEFIAAAGTLGVMAAGAVAAAFWPLWLRLGAAVSLVFPPRWSLRRGLLVITAGLSAAIAASVFGAFEILAQLPWRGISTLALIAVLICLYSYARAKLERRLPRARLLAVAAGALLIGSGAVVAWRLSPVDSRVRLRIAQESAFLPVAYQMMRWATDFDSDGYLAWWGENDCAPWDASIHPLAKDPLRDGVDQDCDGRDGSLAGADLGKGRADYKVRGMPSACPLFLITVDAVSASELVLYGGSGMPLLSERAKRGIVFKWAFSQGPSTRLSMPSMLTSRYDTQILRPMIYGQPAEIESGNETLAEVLSAARYYTAAVSPVIYLGGRLKGIYQGFKEVDRSPNAGENRPGQHTADLVTEAAERVIKARLAENRFFLWAHYFDTHGPFTVEPGDTPKSNTAYGKYQYELCYLDGYLDRLLSFIERVYARRPHVVIVSADHGEAFDRASHGARHHGFDLSTSVTRIPFIIWGLGAPRTIEQPIGLINVMPTLVNIAQAHGQRPEGDSLLPLIAGTQRFSRPVFGQFYLNERRIERREPLQEVAVRLDANVLYYNLETQGYTLFNYQKDPMEENDLFRQQPAVLDLLRATMQSWLERVYAALYERR